MKSTIITTLAAGTVAAVIGGVLQTMHMPFGKYLLLGGVFLTLLSGALGVLQVSQRRE